MEIIKKKRGLMLAAGVLAVIAVFLVFHGQVKVKADISAYGDTAITVTGLTDSDFTITPNELAAMKCVKLNGSGKTAKAGSVTAVGPLLKTFAEHYGKELSDFSKVRFYASDGYKITLKSEQLSGNKVVLSVADGDAPLSAAEQPMRLFIPGAESSNWIYAVTKIEFVA